MRVGVGARIHTGTLEQPGRLLFLCRKTCSNCDPNFGSLMVTGEEEPAGWVVVGNTKGSEFMPAGRPKKLTPKRLQEGVDDYFDSISYERPVMERIKTDRKDADGHWIYEEVPVKNRRGQELKITLFTQPPTKGDLYTFLGIHKSTWSRWLEDEKLQPICERAAQRIENYWARELGGKNANGASKMLERAFDWRAEQTIHMTGGIEDFLDRLKDAGGGEQEF